MLKKNILTKILLSSFMVPSLMVATTNVYAAPGGDSTDQSVAGNTQASTESPVGVTSLVPDSSVTAEGLSFPTTLRHIALPETHDLPLLNGLLTNTSVARDFELATLPAPIELESACQELIKGNVLDLSSICYDNLPRYCDTIKHIITNSDHFGVDTVKFSFHHMYAVAVNSKHNTSKKDYIREIISYLAKPGAPAEATVEFDYMLPLAPDPYNDKDLIDVSSVYSRVIRDRNVKNLKCDSILVYTTNEFKIMDWFRRVDRIALDSRLPGSLSLGDVKLYNEGVLKHMFNSKTAYPLFPKNKCKLKNVFLINQYENQNISEDTRIIRNIFNRGYGVIPSVELNTSIRLTSTEFVDSTRGSILEPVHLANVSLQLQKMDSDNLTFQKCFKIVNSNTGEACKFIRIINGRQFFNLSPTCTHAISPNIQTVLLTNEDLLRMCSRPEPYSVRQVEDRINSAICKLAANNIQKIRLNIGPAHKGTKDKRFYNMHNIQPIDLTNFFDVCASYGIEFEADSLTVSYYNSKNNLGFTKLEPTEMSNILISKVAESKHPLKCLYITGSEKDSTALSELIKKLVEGNIGNIIDQNTRLIINIENDDNDNVVRDISGRYLMLVNKMKKNFYFKSVSVVTGLGKK